MSIREINRKKWRTLASISLTFNASVYVIPDGICRKNLLIIHQEDGICVYDFKHNQWNTLLNIKCEEWFFHDSLQAITFDHKTKQIYFLSAMGTLVTLNLNHHTEGNTKWPIKQGMQIIGSGAYGIMIKNKFHVIGGYQNNKHMKYNTISKTFDTIHIFDEFEGGFGYHRTALLNNNLFVFGGYDIDTNQCLDRVYQYNINANSWNKLHIKLPKPLDSFGCTAVINGKYALLFGGFSAGYAVCDDIYVFSMLTKTFSISEMRCPEHGRFKATTINDRECDEKTVFGFVRNEWKICEIYDHWFPPEYLLRLIHSYYLVEFVDLINCFDGGHWMVDVFDIIGNVL
eukprot:494201_1